AHSRVALGGPPQGSGHGVERALTDVVGVTPVGHVDVQGHAGLGHEGLEDVSGHGRVVVTADHRSHPLGLTVHQVGASGDVDGDLGQRLVHGYLHVGEATDALLVAKSLAESGPQGQCGVLHGVVRVDVQIAFGAHGQV